MTGSMPDRRIRATIIGGSAIFLWSTLALLTVKTGSVPPLQLLFMSFAISGIAGLVWTIRRNPTRSALQRIFRQPAAVWLLGIAGIFGNHVLYFFALKMGPPAEANLINYMYPALIILFAAVLLKERLRWFHIVGTVTGFAGAAVIILSVDYQNQQMAPAPVLGLLAAVGSAVSWALYSVLNRKFKQVPTEIVVGYTLASAALALPLHLALETTVMPMPEELFAILLMGLGPAGAVFFVWDYGTKHGDIRVVSALLFFTPLLSSWLLIIAGVRPFDISIILACLLIVGGSIFASLEMWLQEPPLRNDPGPTPELEVIPIEVREDPVDPATRQEPPDIPPV